MKTIFPIVSLLFLILSCQNNTEPTTSGNPPQNKTASPTNPDAVDTNTSAPKILFEQEGFIEKYNQYIHFQNSFHNYVQRSAEKYYREFNPEQALSEQNRPIIWSYSTTDLSYVAEQANAEPSIKEVDNRALDLYPKAKTLDSLFKLSSFYYAKEKCKDDNYKEGQILSDQVEKAMLAYLESYSNFQASMSRLVKDLNEYEMQRLKEDGLEVRYQTLLAVNKADELINLVYEMADQQFEAVDHDQFKQSLAHFNEAVESLETFSLDEKRLKEELGYSYSYMGSFLTSSAGMVRNCRALQNRIKNNDWNFSITHPDIPDNGSVEKISAEYSDIIRWYNAMQ